VQVFWLLHWGRATGVCWLQHVIAAPVGPAALPGLTPLHLAALLGDAAAVADMLTGGRGALYACVCVCVCGVSAVVVWPGVTPLRLAALLGDAAAVADMQLHMGEWVCNCGSAHCTHLRMPACMCRHAR
jgi:hypothetical protein